MEKIAYIYCMNGLSESKMPLQKTLAISAAEFNIKMYMIYGQKTFYRFLVKVLRQ